MHVNQGIGNHACNMHGHVTCIVLCMFNAPEKRPKSLRVSGKCHACLREYAWYMHELIHYLVYKGTFSGIFHTWNSTPVIVCYTHRTCMFQVLHFE